MARVVVDVMLKPEILDPQGQAVIRALPGLGIPGTGAVTGVRIGKHVEIDVAGDAGEAGPAALGEHIADRLLANPVIEDFTIRVEADADQARGVGPVG